MSVPERELDAELGNQATVFGHPAGLYTLFFAEMWERFSYYGMRALLVFYMIKGFLKYTDGEAYTVYGAYTALVYMTPFFGGLIADRLLGSRISVIIGGALMAAGHLLMGVESTLAFYVALALLIAGNGFFKPNISTIVGSLYPPGSRKRDGGFTIFYIGINLGAAMSPLLCGYIGENYGWHRGFGLATIGMLIGLAVFVMPNRLTQVMILLGAAVSAYGLFVYRTPGFYSLALNAFIAIAVIGSALMACFALMKGGLPRRAGAAARPVEASTLIMVLLGTLFAIVIFTLLVSGFSVVTLDGKPLQIFDEEKIESIAKWSGVLEPVVTIFLTEISKPAGLILSLVGFVAFVYLLFESFRLSKIPRERMWVALILIFFSLLFWAFFEQAGSSINNFTDRNVGRVFSGQQVTEEQIGQTIQLSPTQAQLGYPWQGKPFTLDQLDRLREEHQLKGEQNFTIDWEITEQHLGMALATRGEETPASVFQAINPACILLFGLVFTALWAYLGARGVEPSTPVKFALGLLQLGLGFGAFWMGALNADERGMVAVYWLVLGYALQTTGELCLSPVGLSMICKLSPMRLVSTMMGAWFLATAFSQYLAGIISQFTGVQVSDEADISVPIPLETVDVYGEVFGTIALSAMASGLLCLILSPLLKKWMHEGVVGEVDSAN